MGTFRSPLVARPAPTRQRSTNERPALHRKQTSTTHEGLLRYHRGALGVECRGAGFGSWRGCRVVRRGSAVSRTAAGAPGLVEPSGGQGRRGLRRLAPQVRGRKEAPSRREHRGTWEEPGAVWPGPVRHRLCQGRQEALGPGRIRPGQGVLPQRLGELAQELVRVTTLLHKYLNH